MLEPFCRLQRSLHVYKKLPCKLIGLHKSKAYFRGVVVISRIEIINALEQKVIYNETNANYLNY